MKKEIHPKYYPNTKVKCSCGAEFEIGTTISDVKVEICSACHPLYTGNKRIVDTAGRVDRFQARLKKSEEMKKKAEARTPKAKKESANEEVEEKPKTEEIAVVEESTSKED